MHWIALLTIPLGYIAGQADGWLPNVGVNRGLSVICCRQWLPSPKLDVSSVQNDFLYLPAPVYSDADCRCRNYGKGY